MFTVAGFRAILDERLSIQQTVTDLGVVGGLHNSKEVHSWAEQWRDHRRENESVGLPANTHGENKGRIQVKNNGSRFVFKT